MEIDLVLLAFSDIIENHESLKKDLEGPLSLAFANIIADICDQIGHLVGTEEKVNKIETDNFDIWKLELMSFLRELQCPYEFGGTQERFENGADRHKLLEFLAAELIGAKKIQQISNKKSANLTPIFGILHALNLSQPPANIQIPSLFAKFKERIDSMPVQLKTKVLADPLLDPSVKLSTAQWQQLDRISAQLESEYALRRTMLLTRLNATLQSFSWSERAKDMPCHVADAIATTNFSHGKFSNITVADALAARKDLLLLKKIASDPPETRSSNPLTKVKVGRVPDRGGRPSEMAAPPPEMPSWQQRSGQSHDPRGFQGNRGGHHKGGGHHGGGGGHHGGNKNRHRGVQGAGWKRN